MKKSTITLLVIGATVILAGIAVYTAIRLFQLRQKPVAPNVPESKPAAQSVPTPAESCTATFDITEVVSFECGSPCTTDAECQTENPDHICFDTGTEKVCRLKDNTTDEACEPVQATASPSPTPASCNNSCSQSSDCASGLVCVNDVCRNPSCDTQTDCTCDITSPTPTPTATPTATPATTASPTPAPELPQAGVSLPTLAGIGLGSLLLVVSLLLAF